MILSQSEIREAVAKGEIKFDPPLQDRQWGEAGVDLRLGFKFTKWKNSPNARFSLAKGIGSLASMGLWTEKELKPKDEFGKQESFPLDPDEFVLALTYEKIWIPKHLIALVEGRSSYARAGISMHQTAPWIQPGWSGRITLEIRNSGPLQLSLTPVDDMPCQLVFFQLTSMLTDAQAYGSRPTDIFQNQESPLPKG